MEVVLLLCDWAEELNGKLYIMGGGWSRYFRTPSQAGDMFIAAKLLVPWSQANQLHRWTLQLMTEDGRHVEIAEQAVHIEGKLEVGRPPGLAPGTDLDVPMTFRIGAPLLEAGRYRWEFLIDGTQLARVGFEVVVSG
jgi:hypothetical protein